MDQITIVDGADDAEIAGWIATLLTGALAAAAGGRVAITVPGGSTPFPILAELARAPLPFAQIEVWPGDDRIVPEAHPASNVGRIRVLLEPAGARVVALAEHAPVPHFALAWLGMGTDGHIASLFPNADPRADDPLAVRRIVPDPLPPEAPFARLSLTIPALASADALLFVIRGPDKAALFDAGLAGAHDLPVARLLRATRAPVQCFR